MYLILLLLLISSHTLSAQQCEQTEYKIRGLDTDESAEDDNEFETHDDLERIIDLAAE